mgnify:CR=1 FL=1|jgi:fatty acid desaturase|tara:strand:+ start:223 stop:1149 length:927 start_codon:yes stop_codon:yes gene_type:complete
MENSGVKPLDILSKEQYNEIKKTEDWRNIFSIASNWLQIVAAMVLFYMLPNAVTFFIALVIIGSKQFALAVLVHEGAHNLLFSNRILNDWSTQWLCAYPIFQDNRAYRPYHLKHHRFTETEEDPDLVLSAPFPITKSSFLRKIVRDLLGITGFRRYKGTLQSIFRSEKSSDKSRLKTLWFKIHGFLVTNIIIFTLISSFLHWSLFFLLWWLPALTYYSLIIRIRNIAEHSVTDGDNDLNNTRTTKASLLLKYFLVPLNVNYHLEHHLFTRCPWYNLPKAHKMLLDGGYADKMCIENSYGSVLRKATSK